MAEQSERLSALDVTALNLHPENVFSDMDIEWEVNTHREIFDGELFTNKQGVSLDNLKQKLNTKLPVNERLSEEDVFALKPHKKELVTRIKFTTKHRTDNIRALLRSKQGKDVFTAVAKAMLDSAPFSATKDQHHLTQAEMQAKVDQYLEKLGKGLDLEEEPEGAQDEQGSDDDSSSESSEQGNLGIRGADFASFAKGKTKTKKAGSEPKPGSRAAVVLGKRSVGNSRGLIFNSPKRRRAADVKTMVGDLVTVGEDEEAPDVDELSQSSIRTSTTKASKARGAKVPTSERMYDYLEVMAGHVPLKHVNVVSTLVGPLSTC